MFYGRLDGGEYRIAGGGNCPAVRPGAFGLIAGRCSAAQAEGIRRLREQKLYKRCTEKWEDFCQKYLKMSRAEADRTIKLLEEFGATYFELSQLTRVSPETYRLIAPQIENGVLHHNGEAIELNSGKFPQGGGGHRRNAQRHP